MRWSTSVLVAAFVVVDLAVLGGAYVLTHRAPAAAPSGAGDSSSSGPATGSGTSSASSGGTPSWTGPLTLAASGSGRLARVTRGSCDSRQPVRSRVWLAASYQAPVREVTVPGLQETLGVSVDDDRVSIVGTGTGCRAFGFVSTDDGRSWRRGAVPDDQWYLDRDTTAQVVHGPVPDGEESVACTPVGVATVADGEGLVSCQSDSVYRLRPGQRTQPTQAQTYPTQSPVAAAETGAATLALGAVNSCPAALARLALNGSLEQLACLSRDDAPLGLATSGSRIFAQVGYRLLYSTDGGTRFTAYPGTDEGATSS